jgi:NAD(P)-dependent dehydrogenase (short-subunit alcohol dehydrogenase family)
VEREVGALNSNSLFLIAGIGAGVAKAFAKYGPKDANAPYIILIGRSRQGAEDVINEMKKHNSNGKYEFIQGDLSLMKGVRGVAAEIAGKVDEINYLCMSQGIMTMKTKDDTEEGIDRKMSLHFYSRYRIPILGLTISFLLGNLLLPKLEKSADKGEDARVLSVLAAGKGGAIDLNDLGLKDSYGLKRKADSATTYNDLMIEVGNDSNLSDGTGVVNSTS